MSTRVGDVVEKLKTKQEDKRIKGVLLAAARASTPKMMRALAICMKDDVRIFTAKSGIQIAVEQGANEGIRFSHADYPTFFLTLEVDRNIINCNVQVMKSSMVPSECKDLTIEVVCDGQGKLYYKIEDVKAAHASKVSEALLRSLLENLA